MHRRVVPVGVESQDRDDGRRFGRDRFLDEAAIEMDSLHGIARLRHAGLDVLEACDGPDVGRLLAGRQQLLGRRAVEAPILLGRFGHALERVEQVQVAVGHAACEEGVCDRLHAAAAPNATLDDRTWDIVVGDVSRGNDERV